MVSWFSFKYPQTHIFGQTPLTVYKKICRFWNLYVDFEENIMRKCMNIFFQLFRIGSTWKKEHCGTFWAGVFYTWLDFFTFFNLSLVKVCTLAVLLVVNWTLGNKYQWNFNRNIPIFIWENEFENAVYKMAAMMSPKMLMMWNDPQMWCRKLLRAREPCTKHVRFISEHYARWWSSTIRCFGVCRNSAD